MGGDASIGRRRRRRVEAKTSRGTRLWWAAAGLLVATLGDVHAGRSEVSWPHTDELGVTTAMVVDAAGAMVVTGCSSGGETFYVAKFSDRGQQLWRETLRAQDVVAGTGEDMAATVCSSALSTDAALNIFVTGAVESDQDAGDVFIVRLGPSGTLEWTQTLGTPLADVATSLCVSLDPDGDGTSSVFVGGYSAGNISRGRDSPPNCQTVSSENGVCDDGFIARLSAMGGAVLWAKTVSSSSPRQRGGETRVFDVVAVSAQVSTPPSLVMVGETRGWLTPTNSSTRHAGDVFVRRVAFATGDTLWTKQLSAPGDTEEFCQQRPATASPSAYLRVYPRGRCGVALHAAAQEVSVVGTTRGLLSTLPSQQESYAEVCGDKATTDPCMQLFVARLKLTSGTVVWVRQADDAVHTAAEGVLALPGASDILALASVDAGFFPNAESMEQLAVFRVGGRDGLVRWTSELGLTGEDHAVAIRAAIGDQGIFVAGHGSADPSQRGRASAQSYVRRVRVNDGAMVPLCVDLIGFDVSQGNRTNATTMQSEGGTTKSRRIVDVPLRRDEATRCVGAVASIRYRYRAVSNTVSSSSSSVTGLVEFTALQSTANIAVTVPRDAVSLRVSLEQVVEDSQVDSAAREWVVDLVNLAQPSTVVDSGSGAADGRLWQQLTWATLVGTAVVTALVVVAGRVVCRRASAWSWRRAKLFQYSTLRLRRPHQAGNRAMQDEVGPSEETEELRSHLEEIQQLNNSLDGLLRTHLAPSASFSSPRSATSVEPLPPPPPRHKTSGWKRSLRRIGSASSPKKR